MTSQSKYYRPILKYIGWSQCFSPITNHYYERTTEFNIVNFVLWNNHVLKFYFFTKDAVSNAGILMQHSIVMASAKIKISSQMDW